MDSLKSSVNQRFIQVSKMLVEKNHVPTVKEFCEKIGIHQQVLSDIRTNKRGVTIEMLSELLNIFNINPTFLLDGKGEIFIIKKMHGSMHGSVHGFDEKQNETPHLLNEPVAEYKKKGFNYKKIPFYDIQAAASSAILMFNDHPEHPSSYIYVPGFDDCTLAMNVWGESMESRYKNGDIIICKDIKDKSLIMYGNAYVVVTKEHRHLKYMHKHTDKALITLRSHNDRFEDFEIKREDILMLFLVKGCVKRDAI